jgi:hypothetical protein
MVLVLQLTEVERVTCPKGAAEGDMRLIKPYLCFYPQDVQRVLQRSRDIKMLFCIGKVRCDRVGNPCLRGHLKSSRFTDEGQVVERL